MQMGIPTVLWVIVALTALLTAQICSTAQDKELQTMTHAEALSGDFVLSRSSSA